MPKTAFKNIEKWRRNLIRKLPICRNANARAERMFVAFLEKLTYARILPELSRQLLYEKIPTLNRLKLMVFE